MPRSFVSPAFATCCLLIACGANVDVLDGDGGGGDGMGNSNAGASAQGGQGNSGQGNAGQGNSGQGASAQGGAGDGGGINPTGGSGPGPSTSTGMMICDAQGVCGQCVAEACPDVWCSCVNNPDCLPLYDCFFSCPPGNDPCAQDCMAAFPDGISDVVLSNNCATVSCQGACPQGGGEPISPCEECTYSTCPEAMNGCLSNGECLELYACLSECAPNDLSCHQDCYNAHPDGVEDLEDVLDCSYGPCARPCT